MLGEILGLSLRLEEIVGFSLGVLVALEFEAGGSSNMSSPYEILGPGVVVVGFLFGGLVGTGSGGGSSRISSPYEILGRGVFNVGDEDGV